MDDLEALLDPDLTLPIDGNHFRVRCSARQGLRVTRLVALGLELDDQQERIEVRAILGDAYTQLTEAGVSWPRIAFAGRTAILHYGHSPDLAARYWESGGTPGNPIPPSPNQVAMGEKLRNLFRRNASATTNAQDASPAHRVHTALKIQAVGRWTRTPGSVAGTSLNRKQRRAQAR